VPKKNTHTRTHTHTRARAHTHTHTHARTQSKTRHLADQGVWKYFIHGIVDGHDQPHKVYRISVMEQATRPQKIKRAGRKTQDRSDEKLHSRQENDGQPGQRRKPFQI